MVLLDLRARTFDDVPVGDTGGAGGLAGETAEAAVDVGDEGIADGQAAFVREHDLVDASAGRIHLGTEHAIRGAMLQTESAVHARGVELPRGTVLPGEAGGLRRGLDGEGHFKFVNWLIC